MVISKRERERKKLEEKMLQHPFVHQELNIEMNGVLNIFGTCI
jgi:hypothetical protein